MERCLKNHYVKFEWDLTPTEPKKMISCTCQTDGHTFHDVIIGNPWLPQMQWNCEKMVPKYWSFHDDKNVQK